MALTLTTDALSTTARGTRVATRGEFPRLIVPIAHANRSPKSTFMF